MKNRIVVTLGILILMSSSLNAQDLSFISEGPLHVEYWQDGKKAAKNPADLSHGTLNLKAGAPLKVKLAPSGGFVAMVKFSD